MAFQPSIIRPTEAFFRLTIDEAKQKNGTWSLKYISKAKQKLKSMNQSQFNQFMGNIFSAMGDPSTSSLVRFKFAQLSSIVKSDDPIKFDEFLNGAFHLIGAMSDACEDDDLGVPTKKLLLSISLRKQSNIKAIRPMSSHSCPKELLLQNSSNLDSKLICHSNSFGSLLICPICDSNK